MNEGMPLGRIGAVRGQTGLKPHFRLPFILATRDRLTELL
jgi:hypothetical protein